MQVPRLHLRSLDQLSKSSSKGVPRALLSSAAKISATPGSNRSQLALGFKDPVFGSRF